MRITATGDLDPVRIGELHATELARFRQARPRSLAMIARARARMPNGVPMAWMAQDNDQPVHIDHGQGPGFTDIDGFTYLDFNASDMAMFCGHAHPAIVAAVQAQAARSTQFLLPTPASMDVAEELARSYPVGQCWPSMRPTHVVGPGGATATWDLHPDVVTIGKAAPIRGAADAGTIGDQIVRSIISFHQESVAPAG
jgi:glutamate-1-semialdehyde aminotransferase